MTKSNKRILLLFILAFILFNLSIVLNIYFSNLLSAQAAVGIQYLTELTYLGVTFTAIVCFIVAVFLLIKNNNQDVV